MVGNWWIVIRCSSIGCIIGALPGLGGSVVDWIAYGHVIQTSKDRSKFGEGDIRRYYDGHQDQFRRDRPEIKARHILLASHRDANARRQTLKRGTDFAAVAREHSLDVDTRYHGGELGYFSEVDEPALWAAAGDLEPNAISNPIRTVYGYHLIEILERGDAGTIRPIEEVRAEIVEALVRERHQTRLDQLVTRLKDNADWAITDPVPPTAPIDAGTTAGI